MNLMRLVLISIAAIPKEIDYSKYLNEQDNLLVKKF
jgi:hypothetical protein